MNDGADLPITIYLDSLLMLPQSWISLTMSSSDWDGLKQFPPNLCIATGVAVGIAYCHCSHPQLGPILQKTMLFQRSRRGPPLVAIINVAEAWKPGLFKGPGSSQSPAFHHYNTQGPWADGSGEKIPAHTDTHTHIYIYIYMYTYHMYVCMYVLYFNVM